MKSKNLRIEYLKKEDVSEYFNLGLVTWIDKEKGKKILEKNINDFFEYNDISKGICMVLKSEEELIGISFIIEKQHDLNGVNIFNIAIKENLRERGYGKRMLSLLFEECIKNKKIWAFVSTNPKKFRFYEKCGMKEFGRIKNARYGMDRVYLVKKLNS